MDVLEIGIVALTSILTGLIVWYITAVLSEKKLETHFKTNPATLSGHWEGIHLSKDDSRGGILISRHSYELTVNRHGEIKGGYEELSGVPPYKFDVKGRITPGEIFLTAKSKTTEESSVAWFFNLYNLERIAGFKFAHDFDGRPYVSYIVLSRKRLDDNEYLSLLEKDKDMYYDHL